MSTGNGIKLGDYVEAAVRVRGRVVGMEQDADGEWTCLLYVGQQDGVKIEGDGVLIAVKERDIVAKNMWVRLGDG